jgi:hypothetical protein
MRVRHHLRAVLVTALVLVAAPPADATCINGQCLPAGPGSAELDVASSALDSCLYIKMDRPAPPDWDPNNDSGGPYVFLKSKAWGNRPGYQWPVGYDYRFCDLVPVLPTAEVCTNAVCVTIPPIGRLNPS